MCTSARFASAGSVSLGGRREGTVPPGSNTSRKNTARNGDVAVMCCTHEPRSARRAMAQPTAAVPTAMLRKYLNGHLLRTDVVREVFSDHLQRIATRRKMRRKNEL